MVWKCKSTIWKGHTSFFVYLLFGLEIGNNWFSIKLRGPQEGSRTCKTVGKLFKNVGWHQYLQNWKVVAPKSLWVSFCWIHDSSKVYITFWFWPFDPNRLPNKCYLSNKESKAMFLAYHKLCWSHQSCKTKFTKTLVPPLYSFADIGANQHSWKTLPWFCKFGYF